MNQVEENSQELAGEDEGPSKSIRDYIAIARKHWLVILLIVGVGVTASVFYTLRQPKTYSATASVVIDPQPPQVFGNQVQEVITLGTGSFWSNKEYYNTQVEVLASYDLARLTVEGSGLADHPMLHGKTPIEDAQQKLNEAAGVFAGGLQAIHKGDSRIVNISVTLRDPQLAVQLANAHVSTFLNYTRGLRSGGTGEVSKFLATELDLAEDRLNTSEKALLDYKSENNLLSVSLEEKQNILASELTRYTTALGDVRIKRAEQFAALRRAKGLAKEDILETPLFALVDGTGAQDLRAQHAEESRKLRKMGQELGPKHPEYQGQLKQVKAIVGNLEREARRTVRELDETYQATLATERKFQAEVARLKQEAIELEPKSVDYNRLKRDERANSEHYELVLGRLRASNLTGRNEAINIRSHNAARAGVLVGPRLPVNVAIAFFLSLMLGLAIAYLLDLTDRSIKTAEQAQALLGAPVLGIIPIIADGGHSRANPIETKSRDLHVFENPTSPAAECCRAIRTNILFAATDKRMKTLTISSPKPKEGKSTTTIYLGTTMAQSGQRVLLVDADLRRPRLHKALDVPRDSGLTTVLLGQTSLDDAIKTTDVPNLFVLPAGPQPPNPAELLLTDAFKNLLKELEGKFDRILLDSPPLLAVSDPVVLARLSDGVLIVLQAGSTRIDDAMVGVRALRSVKAPIVGVVLNDINLEDRQYGYGSKYYSYGYGEGATSDA